MEPIAENPVAENPVDESRATESPVVELDASRAGPGEAPDLVVRALRAAVARGTAFSAVLLMPPSGPSRRAGTAVATERVRALALLRPQLRAHCRGLAFVVPLAVQEEKAKAIAAGERLWGCPTFVTDDLDRARAWAAARLGPAGV
ncbi:hypothetical protein [Streptomyces sp. NPDC005538]|uniref:hypothetical protein n=1 Tax=unclassified Streptomyces TaxID=2593676 RepID=UPI0033B26318